MKWLVASCLKSVIVLSNMYLVCKVVVVFLCKFWKRNSEFVIWSCEQHTTFWNLEKFQLTHFSAQDFLKYLEISQEISRFTRDIFQWKKCEFFDYWNPEIKKSREIPIYYWSPKCPMYLFVPCLVIRTLLSLIIYARITK